MSLSIANTLLPIVVIVARVLSTNGESQTCTVHGECDPGRPEGSVGAVGSSRYCACFSVKVTVCVRIHLCILPHYHTALSLSVTAGDDILQGMAKCVTTPSCVLEGNYALDGG
jgi:hypothetical protein